MKGSSLSKCDFQSKIDIPSLSKRDNKHHNLLSKCDFYPKIERGSITKRDLSLSK